MHSINLTTTDVPRAAKLPLMMWLMLMYDHRVPTIEHPALLRLVKVGDWSSGAIRFEATELQQDSAIRSHMLSLRVYLADPVDRTKDATLIQAVVTLDNREDHGRGGVTHDQIVRQALHDVVWKALNVKVTIRGEPGVGSILLQRSDDVFALDDQLVSGWFVDPVQVHPHNEHVAIKVGALSIRIQAAV